MSRKYMQNEKVLNSLKKIQRNGITDTDTFQAKQIGLNGGQCVALVRRHLVKVVGYTKEMVCINPDEDIYKKMRINVYQLAMPIEDCINKIKIEMANSLQAEIDNCCGYIDYLAKRVESLTKERRELLK